MARRPTNQPTLVDDPATGLRRRHCRKCSRELTDPASRLAGYGPACHPARRPGAAADHQVEQDAIPGT